MRRHPVPGAVAARPSSTPARRPRRFRPSTESLEGRVVPTSMVAFGSDLLGIAGGGTVWHDPNGVGWSQLGTLTGAAYLTATFSEIPGPNPVAQQQVFAQRADGSVSVYVLGGSGAWTATNGSLFPGTMVGSHNGVDGIAAGGTVWHFDTTTGWSRDGNLAGVVQVVEIYIPQPGTSTLSARGLYAETADDSVWYYDYATKHWTNTGGYLVPGTMITTPLGIAGIAGGGTAWWFAASTGAWNEAAGLGGLVSLSSDLTRFHLVANRPDGSTWSYLITNSAPTAGPWTNTGVSLTPGTFDAFMDPVGVGLDGTVWIFLAPADMHVPGKGVRLPGLTGAVAVRSVMGPSSAPRLVYAQRSDHSIWAYAPSSTGAGTWVDTGGFLL